jgi:hypothetical protein
MAEPTWCRVEPGGYCARVDTLFNLPGVHVLDVAWLDRSGKIPPGLRLVVQTGAGGAGCPGCGVVAEARERRLRWLHDIPAFGAPAELVWRQRRYRCAEPACPIGGFSEDHDLARRGPNSPLRAALWSISCIQRDNASVARRLRVDWHTEAFTAGIGPPGRAEGIESPRVACVTQRVKEIIPCASSALISACTNTSWWTLAGTKQQDEVLTEIHSTPRERGSS